MSRDSWTAPTTIGTTSPLRRLRHEQFLRPEQRAAFRREAPNTDYRVIPDEVSGVVLLVCEPALIGTRAAARRALLMTP